MSMADHPSDFDRGGSWDVVSDAISRTMDAKLPLPATLRALAADLNDRRSASLLKRIAARIERGESLESILSQFESRKTMMGRLLHATSLTSQPAEMISRFVGLINDYIQSLRNIRVVLAYPLICLMLVVFGAVVLTAGWLVPATRDADAVAREFDAGGINAAMFQLLLAGDLISIALGFLIWAIGLLIVLGPIRISRWSLVYQLPIIGRYYGSLNLALFARLMEHLTQAGVGTSQALEAAAMLVSWPRLRRAVNEAAERTSQSSTLEEAVADDQRFPATLRAFLTHPGNKLTLSARFATAGDFFEQQARSHCYAMPFLLLPFVIFGLLLVWGCYAIPIIMWISWIRVLSGIS